MRRRREKVLINVYDLMPHNDYLHFAGLGAYHSGLEVHSREYSFGGHEFSSSGVFICDAKNAPGARFRESIEIGETELSSAEVQAIVDSLAVEFPGNSYNLLTRNCNVFTSELCKRLLNRPAPAWVNRLAFLGSTFHCCLPSSLGIAPPAREIEMRAPAAPPFSGHGYSLVPSDGSAGSPANADGESDMLTDEQRLLERRQKALKAALLRSSTSAPPVDEPFQPLSVTPARLGPHAD